MKVSREHEFSCREKFKTHSIINTHSITQVLRFRFRHIAVKHLVTQVRFKLGKATTFDSEDFTIQLRVGFINS